MAARTRRLLAGAMLVSVAGAALAAALLAPSSHGGRHARPPRVPARAHSAAAAAPVRQSSEPRPASPRPEPSPGTLPQTHVLPPVRSPRFKQLMGALWRGITANSVLAALPAFFPREAYARLKAIPSANTDWANRLVREYRLDIAAAHALLGAGARGAQLVEVSVPASFAHWVPPGACHNGIGYYEVPNARVVYRERGATRSFGIASLISWRGVWYVVHLGSVLRGSEDSGAVDEPSSGTGSSAYSSTC